jgi:transcriptional regulator with XRE-family HTH domain
MIEKKIADKIREIRKTKGLTLSQLGEETGLSKGLLSRIENNQVSPPIATLSKIAQGLDVPISIFFLETDTDNETFSVIQKSERKQILRKGSRIGYTYHSLTQLKTHHVIDPFIVRYPVSIKKPPMLFDHPGEEFILVLKGEINVLYGENTIRLKPGDAMHFDPSVPHAAQGIGEEDSECLVVVVGKEHINA